MGPKPFHPACLSPSSSQTPDSPRSGPKGDLSTRRLTPRQRSGSPRRTGSPASSRLPSTKTVKAASLARIRNSWPRIWGYLRFRQIRIHLTRFGARLGPGSRPSTVVPGEKRWGLIRRIVASGEGISRSCSPTTVVCRPHNQCRPRERSGRSSPLTRKAPSRADVGPIDGARSESAGRLKPW